MTKSKTTQRIHPRPQAVAALFTSCNFDMLKAMVEDMNRYDESPSDVLEYLNTDPTDRTMRRFTPASSSTARGRRSAPREGVATQSGESPS